MQVCLAFSEGKVLLLIFNSILKLGYCVTGRRIVKAKHFLQPRSGLSYSAVGSSSSFLFFLQTFAFWPWYFSFVRGLRFILGDPSYLGTPRTWGPLVPGDSLYLGTPHTWGPLIHGNSSYLGTPHTWRPLIPGDPSYLGTPLTWGPLLPGDPSYLGTPHTWGPHIPGDPS